MAARDQLSQNREKLINSHKKAQTHYINTKKQKTTTFTTQSSAIRASIKPFLPHLTTPSKRLFAPVFVFSHARIISSYTVENIISWIIILINTDKTEFSTLESLPGLSKNSKWQYKNQQWKPAAATCVVQSSTFTLVCWFFVSSHMHASNLSNSWHDFYQSLNCWSNLWQRVFQNGELVQEVNKAHYVSCLLGHKGGEIEGLGAY